MWNQDTIVAVATPPGEGGIAIVRLSGPRSCAIAATFFRSVRNDDPATYSGYSVHYGRYVDPEQAVVVDDGLLTVFRAPHSYTGEDAVECSCHGGRLSTAALLRLALQAGARSAEPGEFTLRAFLNGRIDLAQAEAVSDMIRARTEASHRLARRHLEGAFSHTVSALREELIGILAAIEVTIDFSDEVGELDYDPLSTRIEAVRSRIETLLTTAERGRLLREGLHVALIGRPNVGKSSLLNALLGTDRAIVTPIAGTTRDVLEESANIGGVPVVLVDTAGLRETEDMIERMGIERAENAAAKADVVLLVLDASEGVTEQDRETYRQVGARSVASLVVALNKRDLCSDPILAHSREEAQAGFELSASRLVSVSAVTGAGMETLENALIAAALHSEGGERGTGALPDETVVVANVRHRHALESAQRSLREAETTTRRGLPGDFIAIDVRGALDALGQITGETVTDEVIHRIFRDFCVGK